MQAILNVIFLVLLGFTPSAQAFFHFTSNVTDPKKQQFRIRIGFFPNLTHPQALVAQALTRQKRGWLERYIPENIKIEWQRFNTGAMAMEGLLMGNLDISYVGPSPAINLYMRTGMKEVRLLAGAAKGGSGLVVQPQLSIKKPEDWSDKKIATPQFGNTQDIACRAWFKKQNLKKLPSLLPTANPDQLTLFKKKQIDGAWTIEPWLSRLIEEGQGVLFFCDDTNWTTLLVSSQIFCKNHRKLAENIIKAHKELTQWIKNNIEEATNLIQEELKQQTHLDFSKTLISNTLKKLNLETEISKEEIQKWVDAALDVDFLKPYNQHRLDDFFLFYNITSSRK